MQAGIAASTGSISEECSVGVVTGPATSAATTAASTTTESSTAKSAASECTTSASAESASACSGSTSTGAAWRSRGSWLIRVEASGLAGKTLSEAGTEGQDGVLSTVLQTLTQSSTDEK